MKLPPWIVGALVVLLVAIATVRYTRSLDQEIAPRREAVKAADDKITLIMAPLPRITALRERSNELVTLIRGASSILNSDETLAQALSGIEHARPRAVTITHLKVDGGHPTSVQMTARASTAGALDDFQKALSLLPFCDRVLSSPLAGGGQIQLEMRTRTPLLHLDSVLHIPAEPIPPPPMPPPPM